MLLHIQLLRQVSRKPSKFQAQARTHNSLPPWIQHLLENFSATHDIVVFTYVSWQSANFFERSFN
jgi:hypothetical protein